MKHNIMKRTLAGVMAFLCVAAYMPANVGTGGIFDSTAIVASAEDAEIINSGTTDNGNISWTLDSEGLLYIKGAGEIPDDFLFDLDDDTVGKIKRIEFAENCAISKIGDYGLKNGSAYNLTDVIINTTVPLSIAGGAIGAVVNEYLHITINAPKITSIGNGAFDPWFEPMTIVFNTAEPVAFDNYIFDNEDPYTDLYTVAFPQGSTYFVRGGVFFNDDYYRDEYNFHVEMGDEWMFWDEYGDDLTEGVDYYRTKDESGTLTAQNASKIFGNAKACVQTAATASTCAKAGYIEHYAGFNGGYYVLENNTIKQVTADDVSVPTLPHTYNAPTWTWGKDFASQEEQGDVYASGTVNVSQLKVGDIILAGTTIYSDKLNDCVDTSGWPWFFYSADHPFNPNDGGGLAGLSLGASFVAPNPLRILSINRHEIAVEENTKVLDKDVTANFTCGKCEGVEKAKAVVTSQVASEPTYTAAGKIVYTATATFEGSEYTATKEAAIPQLTLTHHDAVAPSCTEDGTVEYWHDENLDKYFADASGTTELTSIVVPATGHQYGSPEWANNTDGSVTATFTCDKCGETKTGTVTAEQMQTLMSMSSMVTKTWNWANDYSTASVTLSNIPAQALALINDADLRNEITANGITVQAVVTSKDVAATCTTPGQKLYTAAVYTLTDTKTVDVSNALGHTYGAPEWHWNEDFTQATATFTCEKGDSTESEEAVVTSDKQDGKTIYTATVTFNGQKYTDVQEVSTAPVILITAQPEDVSIVAKKNVSFSVEAVEGCTYQWFYRRSAAAAWAKVVNNGTSATYTTSGNADRDGWQFYCVVTKGDATEESQVATLHYETLITAQPEDITIHSKKNVTFEVGSAEDCTYQWFYRKSATSNWIRVSNGGTDASYTTTGQATRDGWQFCCKVMKNGESVLSDVATLNYQSLITAQPEDVTISGKQDVTFTVESTEDCTYQWFYRKSATSNWIRVSNGGTDASYTTAGQNTRDGWQFCCKVMKNGESVLSDVATLNYQSLITAQPEDVTISTKQNVTFTVASEEGCTYEWYYRWGEGKPWIKVTNKGTSASYTTVGQNTRDGWQFCCKVIKGDGSELSEIATLHAEY